MFGLVCVLWGELFSERSCLASGAALATVGGVLIEVPVMLMLVGVCTRTRHWFTLSDAACRVSLSKAAREGATEAGVR